VTRSAILHLILTAAISVTVYAPGASGATYVVRPDATGDFSTIQDAITAASGGDVIELTDGTFMGDGNRDIDFFGKALTLRSQSGNPGACVIDCEGSPGYEHRGFHFQTGEGPETSIEGITLTGAHKSENAGGVYCLGASPTFVNCIFADNTSWYSGGAFYGSGCQSSFTDCIFSGNTAYEGGGAVNLFNSSSSFTRCTFSDNESVMYHGGAMRCNLSSPKLMDCVFELNSAYGGGGAIRCYPASDPVITDCVFFHNWAGLGGAIDCFSSSPTLTGCVFEDNTASYGGAIRCDESFPTLSACTLAHNMASYGGGIWCEGGSSPTLDRTLIAFSAGGAGLGCDETVTDLTLTCCDIYGNMLGDWIGCIAGHLGQDANISVDPLFCDDCLYLQECSPCLGAYGCGRIGAYGIGCPCGGGPSGVKRTSWGEVKRLFME